MKNNSAFTDLFHLLKCNTFDIKWQKKSENGQILTSRVIVLSLSCIPLKCLILSEEVKTTNVLIFAAFPFIHFKFFSFF